MNDAIRRIISAWTVSSLIGSSLLMGGCAQHGKVPREEERIILHRVLEGETLEQIADDYYGDPSRTEDLKAYNGLEERVVVPGMLIHVPLSGEEVHALKNRKEARIPYNEGLDLAARGAYLNAIEKFKSALAIDPDFVDARYNLGVTYQNMKAYDQALVHYRKLIRLRPNNPAYHFAIGFCLFHIDRHRQAAVAFERVLAIDPGHARAQFSLAAALEKMGKLREAREAYHRYLEIDSQSEWASEARKRIEKLAP